MALIIAGDRSGSGKTTITLALLAALRDRGISVQPFKVGPDYIDPMFHGAIAGLPCRNLDPLLTSEDWVRRCFFERARSVECAVVEGVMGLFDGVPPGDRASTAHVARLLQIPVLLVVDCRGLSGSVAAVVRGFANHDPQVKIAGAVLNRVGSDRHLEILEDALEPLQIPILGVLRREREVAIPDRHLGLVPAGELSEFANLVDRLAAIGNACFRWDRLLPLLSVRSPAIATEKTVEPIFGRSATTIASEAKLEVNLAIAYDKAFNFYYPANFDLLRSLGARLLFWSPLAEPLPSDADGLYLGGGFPEVFAAELAANLPARQSVADAVRRGMPTYAECGGLMYLCQHLTDFDRKVWEMVGILPADTVMGDRLTLGYRVATAQRDSPAIAAGETVVAHEFHRSTSTASPERPLFSARGFSKRDCSDRGDAIAEGWCGGETFPRGNYQLHASYLHLHWGATPELPRRFLQCCFLFRDRKWRC